MIERRAVSLLHASILRELPRLANDITVNTFLLQRHVFACVTADGGIFLDARRGKYFGYSARVTRPLSTVLQGCPSQGDATSPDTSEATQVAARLVQSGLLTQDEEVGKAMAPVNIAHADAQLEWDITERTVRFDHARTFALAYAATAPVLRCRLQERIFGALRRHKEPHTKQPQDPRNALELAYIFRSIRTFAYSPKERCLLDSLVLMRFLFHYGVYPTLVFGVRVQPFAAHCWVQTGRLTLNCPLEYTRAFTPIRVI